MNATRPCDPGKEEGLALGAKRTKGGGGILFLAMDQSITQKQKVGVSYGPIFKTGNYFLFLLLVGRHRY